MLDNVSKWDYNLNKLKFLIGTKKRGDEMRTNLKRQRQKLGLTQAEVANKVGIARTSYTNIENGNKNPSLKIALKIKEIFNIKNDDIFLSDNVPNGNKTKPA